MLLLPENGKIIIGVDEAGLGPLAFDVVAASTIMPWEYEADDKFVGQINDSKKITNEKKRNVIAEYIKNKAICYGIGTASIEEIDTVNVLQARFIAMHRAIDNLLDKYDNIDHNKHDIDLILVDGDKFKPYTHSDSNGGISIPHTCCIRGDATHLNIAAASILAKTYRDNMINDIVKLHPELDDKYGFLTNKGYGTVKHMTGLKLHGICEYHRKSYEPVKKIISLFQ